MPPQWLRAAALHRDRGAAAMLQQAQGVTPQATLGNATGPDFSVSIGQIPDVIVRGTTLSLTTIVAALDTYSGPVKLTVDGTLPTWLTVAFTPDTVTPVQPRPNWSATISSQLQINASYVPTVKVSGSAAPQKSSPAAWAALIFMLLGPIAFAKRLRRLAPLCAIALFACLPLLSGCGEGRYPPVLPSEVYSVTVVATGANGLQHTVPLVLRVQ